jgi:hypothetical protein
LERTQAVESKRLEGKVAAQKDLLAELARRQAAAVSTAAASGMIFPQDALGMMRGVQQELETKRVVNSLNWLRGAAARLRMETANKAFDFPGAAAEEEAIRAKLDQGTQAPDEGPNAESAAAGQAQAQVRKKTAALQSELRKIDAEDGGVPGEALGKIDDAQGEQAAAESALGEGHSSPAKSHEEQALSLLSSGSQALSKAMSGSQSVQAGMGKMPSHGAFKMVGGGQGGGSGTNMNFVPLPSDQDYAPPREIRDELKKSLQENRPSSMEGVIKEYFKRISQ